MHAENEKEPILGIDAAHMPKTELQINAIKPKNFSGDPIIVISFAYLLGNCDGSFSVNMAISPICQGSKRAIKMNQNGDAVSIAASKLAASAFQVRNQVVQVRRFWEPIDSVAEAVQKL